MNAVVFEHVRVNELPAAWQAQLSNGALASLTQVTVRIEEESDQQAMSQAHNVSTVTANPLFGMWRDREDLSDVAAHVRGLRAPRLNADGTRRKQSE